MELCYSTSISSTFLQFKPSSLLFSPSISLSNTKKPFTSTKLSLSSPKFSLLRHTSSTILTCAAISTSSAAVEPAVEPLPADIDVKETPEPNSRIRLSVEVPPVVCEDCYKRVLNEFTKQAKVPGFRPGKKVPENILVSYVGKESVQKATIESILKRTLPHVMSSVTGRALKDSIRIDTKFSDMEKTYSSLKSLRYEVIVDVAPEVKWVPKDAYKNLKVVVEIDNEIDAQTAFEQELKHRHKSLSSLRIAIDRGLQIGDVAVLDISATTIEKDGLGPQNIPSAETKGFEFDSEDGDRILPGFLDSIIGIKAGETKSFKLVFPESWKQENLRGVEAQFTVECKELFYRVFPELDDTIADKLLPGCTTIKQVKEALLQKCQEMEQTAKEQAADNVILYQLQKVKASIQEVNY